AQQSQAKHEESKLGLVRELCSFDRRLSGTDAERRAANAMATRLRRQGRRAEIESIYVHPQAPLVWALYCVLVSVGSVLSISQPEAGFALVLVATTAFYLDLNTSRHFLRLLFFRRASQNVVSRGRNADATTKLILAAHLDTARTGMIFGKRATSASRRISGLLPFPHTRLLFWSAAVLLPILGARTAGVDTDGLAVLQVIPTLILIVSAFLLVDWRLGSVVPGANDNASGVAVTLSLAERLEAEPTGNLDVWVVLTGGEECGMEGMRSFARSHKDELDPYKTIVLAIDSVGAGDVRWVTAEGMTISFDMDLRVDQLCEAIAEADAEDENRFRASALRHGYATDALAARVAGLRASAITTLEPGAIVPANHHTPADMPDSLDPEAMDRAEDFTLELIRALDRDLGRTERRPQREKSASAA
ncbi:MAG TPA: M28 family peptidase, partial [Solirubrobacterales bacterium]|nr:M28 family peptidase [Solirubrobacterales bacterium]